MQRQHGLDGPFAIDVIPVMPGKFVAYQDPCQQRADRAFGPVTGFSEEEQEQVEEYQCPQRGKVSGSQILEGGTRKCSGKEIGEEVSHVAILHRNHIQQILEMIL